MIVQKRILQIVLIVTVFIFTGISFAHCDAKNGPVAIAARQALKTGNFEPVQIWVGEKQEQELKQKFKQSLSVYRKGGKARQLAEDYFTETAIRLHRAAEGFPFTGVKPAKPLPPDIQAAEKTLDKGDVEIVTDLLKKQIDRKVQKWHKKALKAKERKDESVQAGREWVDKYVKYVIYVHGIYQKIQAGPPHGVGK